MTRPEFETLLRKLAALLPCKDSLAIVRMHNGRVQSVTQDSSFRLKLGDKPGGSSFSGDPDWTANDDALLASFVRERLADPLRQKIGDFGHLKLDVKGGMPTDYWLESHFRYGESTEPSAAPARYRRGRGRLPASRPENRVRRWFP